MATHWSKNGDISGILESQSIQLQVTTALLRTHCSNIALQVRLFVVDFVHPFSNGSWGVPVSPTFSSWMSERKVVNDPGFGV